jgi:hypothetical protein
VAFLEEISETSAKSLGLDWYSVPEMAEKKNKPQARAGEGKSSTVPQAGAGA